jgi:3-isopropylmalate/(R)-2-methylmalate dehydratase large subunit
MGMTMVQKILARASGKEKVAVGDIVTVAVDLAVIMDLPFSTPGRPRINRVFDPEKIAVVLDHAIPAPNVETANGLRNARRFVKQFGIKQYFGEGRHGISHQLLAEHGLVLPGSVLACGDSHTCAAGAFNCAARGVGSDEMMYVITKGTTWFIAYPTIQYRLTGRFSAGTFARDLVHHLAGRYGDHVSRNIEYLGPAVEHLGIDERQTIATMSAELSAEFATFAADQRTIDYLGQRRSASFEPVFADPTAEYEEVREIDLCEIEPTVVMPHRVAHNVKPASEVTDLAIDQAFIGSCANARIEDFRIAAQVLKGRHVHPSVRLLITPSSSDVMRQASREGLIEIFIDAGAVVTNATCGACYGGHMGIVGDGERCITSSTRNFKGRMGSPNSEVLLASPATVAASAIAGTVQDPRKYFAN